MPNIPSGWGAAVSAESSARLLPKVRRWRRLSPAGAATQAVTVELGAIVNETPAVRWPIGLSECDRVLGGGLASGSVSLLTGEPGVGKSTLVLAAAEHLGRPVLYVSGEEAAEQVAARLKRLGLGGGQLTFTTETDVTAVSATVRARGVSLVVIDSLQTMGAPGAGSAAGSPLAMRAALSELVSLAKSTGCAVLVIGHVTKEGLAAGPKTIEHLVDVVLTLEGVPHQALRFLRASKNRFGPTDEIGVFAMDERGFREVPNPSAIFLAERHTGAGSCITALQEGSRSVLIEVQALVTHTRLAYPKRATTGFDANRLQVLLAVLSERAGVRLNYSDVYVNLAGGFRSREPALDLAVCAAVASAAMKKPLPKQVAVFGEVGLGGEVRPVVGAERRLSEAARLGFTEAVTAPFADDAKLPPHLALVGIRNLPELIDWLR